MSSIETSLHPVLLLIGAGVTVAFFVYLLLQQTKSHNKRSRWALCILRSVLSLLMWLLIAQPRAVITSEILSPVTANLGVDVSQSMSLTDAAGINTAAWKNFSNPQPIDEALTLTEAARIRLNLLNRNLSDSTKEFDSEIERIIEILNQVGSKLDVLGSDTSLARLLKKPLMTLASSTALLEGVDSVDFIVDLHRASKLISQTAISLRRINAIQYPASDVIAAQPRINLVNQWLKKSTKVFEDISERYDFEFSTFSNELSKQELSTELKVDKSGVAKTHLYENLNNLGRSDYSKGTQISLLVTDGYDSGDMEKHFSDDILSQPLIVFPVGDVSSDPDAQIDSVVCPSRIREKDMLVASVLVSSKNSSPELVTISLKEGDKVLQSKEVRLRGDGTTEQVDIEWEAIGVGAHKLKVELSSVTGETILSNNSTIVDCSILKDNYKVLVSDAFPRWETRYLQNLFNRDASIKMSSIVFEPKHSFPGKAAKAPIALPFDLETWKLYDLVILGDVTPEQLTPAHQNLLLDYINDGGNLIILAGAHSMPSRFIDGPLGAIIPMTKVRGSRLDGTFIVHPPLDEPINRMVRLQGEKTQQVWRSIFEVAPQYSLTPWLKAKSSANVLLKATGSDGANYDFCATQRYGSGRVAYFAAPCLYHLRFRYGDKYHAKLWGQIIRGMCVDNYGFSDNLISTRLQRTIVKAGEEIQGRLRLRDENGKPFANDNFNAILSKDGTAIAEMKPIPVDSRPGDFYIRFRDVPSGEYELHYSGEEIQGILDSDQKFNPDKEPIKITVSEDAIINELQIADKDSTFWNHVNSLPLATTITPGTLSLMIDALDFKSEIKQTTSKQPLWNSWALLITILVISAFEWIIRRLTGLS